VLISHNHYDHLDLRSVRALSRQRCGSPSFAVPLGLERWFHRRLPDANAVALDWWESRIAIGHYEPRWFMRNNHIDPEEVVRIHGEIGARRSLGIHWGTFERLTPEPLDQPLRDLAAARLARGVAGEEFFVLRHGQTRVIE
jgi:L-ascorbate metabolism protein UlaG (beta-lactamase superfamily)